MAIENEGLKPPRMPNQPASTVPAAESTSNTQSDNTVAPVVTAPVVPTAPIAEIPGVTAPVIEQKPDVLPEASAIESTGNAVLDVAVGTFVSMTGCTDADIKRALGKAAEYADEGLIDTAFLKERFGKHGDQAIALAKAVLQQELATAASSKAAAQAAVVEVAGSAENWNSAVTVFNAHADAETKQMVKVLLDNGLIKQGAAQLMQFVQASGRVPVVSGLQLQGSPVNTNAGLSAAEFSSELQKLKTEAAGRSLETGPFSVRYNELMQRRAAGRAAGK